MRCVALFSGGLDSQLAVRLMQQQHIDVHAVTVETTYSRGKEQVQQRAAQLAIPWTLLPVREDYLDVLRHPRFGYGRGANPCVDCRIYMCRRAIEFMLEIGAHFLVTGEILGQRPMSQKRRDLDIVAFHSQAGELLLRPLSARLLPPTLPERAGWVDRTRLGRFSGRNRRRSIALAHSLGITDYPPPSTGCPLTEKLFGGKVFDLLQHQPDCSTWDFLLLRVGRHFRLDAETKVVVGRHESDNLALERLHERSDTHSTARLAPADFQGPAALLVGPPTPAALQFAVALVLRFAGAKAGPGRLLHLHTRSEITTLVAHALPAAEQALPVTQTASRP